MTASPITTHILDLARGQPASGITVTLAIADDSGGWTELASGSTDLDGRIKDLLSPDHPLTVGEYRLDFATAAYFQKAGVPSFYPLVVIHFRVDHPSAHYHVPLLLSPFGYSTYRGS